MSRLYRTLLGIQSGPPPGTKEITFNVKEWFLDPDNDFIDTEIAALHYMTVNIVGVESKLTSAQGQAIFNLAPGTYTWQVFDNARYLTTRQGSITVTDSSIVVDVKIYACLYKPTEVWDMINNEGYVPVATAAELDGLRNATGRRMGQGTIFDTVSNVVTGITNKKYIQVQNVDLNGVTWNRIGVIDINTSNNIKYRGNELSISNLTSNSANALFGNMYGCVLDSIRIINANITGVVQNTGILLHSISSLSDVNSYIENCFVHGTININANAIGGVIGYNTNQFGIITNCKFVGSVNGSNYVGGISGENYGTITSSSSKGAIEASSIVVGGISGSSFGYINDSHADVNVTGSRRVGGIAGENYGTITNSSSKGTVTVTIEYAGGAIGWNAGVLVEDCWSNANVICSTGTGNVVIGGFMGAHETGGQIVRRCYATGSVTSIRPFAAGFTATTRNGVGNISDCFATGNVSGTSNVGGFSALIRSNVINSYSVGAVTATTSTNVGGFAGQFTAGTITNSYYDT
jgi:hypothetical protein